MHRDAVVTDAPVAFWRFDGDGDAVLRNEPGAGAAGALAAEAVGKIALRVDGPRPGDYPSFAAENQAIEISGNGHLRVRDPGADSPLDFALGDNITLEAWVLPDAVRDGGYSYIVGKGRTENAGFARDNQNYALRLAGGNGSAGVAFLFRSAGADGDWHRWTSEFAMPVDGGWHHVAVTYTFGKPDSIRGYVDGDPLSGKWDMGGATDRGPVVDDDELWIGSSMGGSPSSTFQGRIDEVAIYRSSLTAERISARYHYSGIDDEDDLSEVPDDSLVVDIFEGIPDKMSWQIKHRRLAARYATDHFAFAEVPNKYTPRGVKDDWASPFLLRATGYATIPAGPQRILLRCRNAARLSMDGQKIAETRFHNMPASGHGQVQELDASLAPNIRPLPRGDSQTVVEIEGDGQRHLFQLEVIVGGRKLRPELGETSVSVAAPGGDFFVLGPIDSFPLTDRGWTEFQDRQLAELRFLNAERRSAASAEETEYWHWRHELARSILAEKPGIQPPTVSADFPANNAIDRFLGARLEKAGETPAPLSGDLEFLRRLSLDVTGTIPTTEQIDQFLADREPNRRARWIDRMLASDGWADHWVGYWQDVLAENPNIVNPTLNNTGPFRWWIHESFWNNTPLDRMVTELVMMEGSEYFGGPAGFGMATQNDAPMAAKAHILGQAFLALEMKCARCHDAPYHDLLQSDLFSTAAMLRRGPQEVPATSTIPGGDEAVKSLLVEVTLKPGERVPPVWVFEDLIPNEVPDGVLRSADDSRERLAALITSPRNRRFAQVIANRLWHRYLGRGLIEPVDDWEYADPSHPELLDYLADELIASGYDLKHLARLILNSHTYQRIPRSPETISSTSHYLFAAPVMRRMTAEQLVDSLFVAAGKPFDAGRMSIDIDGARAFNQSLDLGVPRRAWQFASMSNERDRPSLSLPFVHPFVTLLETFGWRSSRQDPLTVRNQEATVLQPAIMANGTITSQVSRLTDDSRLTEIALMDQPLDALIDHLYLRLLTRPPGETERAMFHELLAKGYEQRRIDAPLVERPRLPRGLVSWSNHLHPQANVIQVQLEEAVRQGDPPTARLDADWRQRMEDMVWTLINSPEFVFVP
ncbi:MAG: DUF1553 domain-containing protein [Pirellulaceae bacterium]|nr:DUF1553 domain-containing protein [Pirellulaceae bacterium]